MGGTGMGMLAFAIFVAGCSGQSSSTSSTSSTTPGSADTGGGVVVADGPCVSGTVPTFLIPGIARGIAVDDAFVYTATNDGIARAPRAGGAVEKLASGESPVALTADGTSLYFFDSHPAGMPDANGKVSSGLALYAIPLVGGTPRILVDGAYGQGLLSDGTYLYRSDGGGIEQLPLAGGAGTTSAVDRATSIEAMALGRDAIFIAAYTIGIGGSASSGSIRRMPRGGGAIATIVSGLAHPVSIALDADRLYFADEGTFGGGTVGTARLDGSDLRTVAAVSSPSVAVDTHAVYYALGDRIVKVDKTTGASSDLAVGAQTPGDLVIRGGNIYWVNATSVALSAPNPPYGIMTVCK